MTSPVPLPPIAPKQVRDARKLLGWSRDRLAMQSETIVGFVAAFEHTGRIAKMVRYPEKLDPLGAIRTALEAAGIEFTNGDKLSVKLRSPKT